MAAKARASAGRTNRQKTGRPVYGSAYVHGTAAPKLEPKTAPSPERPGKKPADRRSVRASHRIRRNQERAMYMDLPYVIMLTENDALETSINTSVDLNKIYEIATKELGMVYARKNQVLLYDKTESEYVRQYEDIPEY